MPARSGSGYKDKKLYERVHFAKAGEFCGQRSKPTNAIYHPPIWHEQQSLVLNFPDKQVQCPGNFDQLVTVDNVKIILWRVGYILGINMVSEPLG